MTDKFTIWKNHFINQAKGLIPHQHSFYGVSSQNKGNEVKSEHQSKIMLPTQEIVERVKRAQPNPLSIYDPVTGEMSHFSNSSRGVRRSYTRRVKRNKTSKKSKTHKRKTNRKRKVTKSKRKKVSKKK